MIVSTDSAGSRALIQVGRNPNGPFRSVSPEQSLSGATTFTLAKGSAGRYVVVWITQLPQAIGEAHVTEVRAVGN